MWAAIASAAAAAIAGAVRTVGGIKTAKLNKEIENAKILQAQKNEAYYKAQANQNPLNANRAVINEYNKYANDKLRATENTNTILGRTPDNTVATQKKLAQGQAEMLGTIGQAHERNRNEYLDKANQASNYVTQAKLDTKANNLAQWNTTMQNATTAASNMINAFGSIDSSESKTPEELQKQQEQKTQLNNAYNDYKLAKSKARQNRTSWNDYKIKRSALLNDYKQKRNNILNGY